MMLAISGEVVVGGIVAVVVAIIGLAGVQIRGRHERKEQLRPLAVEAFSKASAVIKLVNPNTIHVMAESAEHVDRARQAVAEAEEALTPIHAGGSNKEMREAAYGILDELSKVWSTARATAGSLRSGNPNAAEMIQRFDERFDSAQAALDRYRETVAE